MNLWGIIRAKLGRWQELLWLPALFALLIGAYYLLPQIDPRAGIDGFGGLWASGITAFNVILAGFLAWLLRTLYFRELTDIDERELLDHACGIDRDITQKIRIGAGPQSWTGIVFLLGDRVLWLATFALIFLALQG